MAICKYNDSGNLGLTPQRFRTTADNLDLVYTMCKGD